MSAANTLTIARARDALRARSLSAVELTEACLTAIEAAAPTAGRPARITPRTRRSPTKREASRSP